MVSHPLPSSDVACTSSMNVACSGKERSLECSSALRTLPIMTGLSMKNRSRTMLVAMTVAGSDSIGGAGIAADIKAFASQGVHAAVAITAITSQNTRQVTSVLPLPTVTVISQIDAVLSDVHVSAIKTGMLYSADIARSVSHRLSDTGIPLVVDPVMVAGVGDKLAKEDLIGSIRKDMAPIATLLTPNIPEAEALLGHELKGLQSVRSGCIELAELGAKAVLIKGGHSGEDPISDVLYYDGKFLEITSPRYDIRGHGGGCVLSSYIAANLAKGMSIWRSTISAKACIDQAISDNYSIGGSIPIISPLAPLQRKISRITERDELASLARRIYTKLLSIGLNDLSIVLAYAPDRTTLSEDVWVTGQPMDNIGSPRSDMTAQHATEMLIEEMRSDRDHRLLLGLNSAIDVRERFNNLIAGTTMPISEKEPTDISEQRPIGTTITIISGKEGPIGKGCTIWLLAKYPDDILSLINGSLG